MSSYDSSWLESVSGSNWNSATTLVPLIVGKYQPKSVVDFGCGLGIWGRALLDISPQTKYLGIDGPYVNTDMLKIPTEFFMPKDLNYFIEVGSFEMAFCLETIEHIEPENSENLIQSLVRSSNRIVFSGAIPNQGGTHHVNEQWLSYWIEKFGKHGYIADFNLRKEIWNDDKIQYHYRQNVVIFEKSTTYSTESSRSCEIIDAVHPQAFLDANVVSSHLKDETFNLRRQIFELNIEIQELNAILEINRSKILGKLLPKFLKGVRRARLNFSNGILNYFRN